jgi:tRNA pseudouridine38-40 synthase
VNVSCARTVKLTLEYDGTDYNGWQIQKGRPDRTVQGEIEKALKQIFGKPVPVRGSGRTDAGVHARGQVAHIQPPSDMSAGEIVRALNGNLPRDVSILSARDAASGFHAQYSAVGKTYRYQILNRPSPPAIDRRFVWHYPHRLDLRAMRETSRYLLGRHDFASFCATDPARAGRDTIRRVSALAVRKSGGLVRIDIQANGFLYKMVRNIVGTLVAVGNGRLEPGQVRTILRQKDRKRAAETAPACGLTLLKVDYK